MKTENKRRKEKTTFLVFILLFIFLVSFSTTTNALVQETNSPFPAFQLAFDQTDAPVKILTAEFDSDQYTVPIPFTADDEPQNTTFTFSSNVYLLNGDYTLQVNAEDKDGNILPYTQDISVNANTMDMWISQPPHQDYQPSHNQDIAINNKKEAFNISLETEYPAVCKIKRNLGTLTDIPATYENFMLTSFNEGDQTPTTHHTLHVPIQGMPYSYPQNSFIPPLEEEFDYDNYQTKSAYLVVCRQEAGDGTYVYHPKIFYIGYDTQEPDFDIHVTPETITDTAAIRTNLHIDSTQGDLLGCHFDYIENPQPQQTENLGPVMTSFPLQNIQEFQKSYNIEFDFQSQLQEFPLGTPLQYTMNVTCSDLGGNTKTKTISYTINLTTNFNILLARTHYHDKKPLLNFTTSALATCMATFDYEGQSYSEIMDDGTPTNNHEYQIPTELEDGNYEINILCTAETQQSKDFTFTVDTIAPEQPVLNSSNYYCGDGLAITIEKPPLNDTVQYNITIYNGTDTTQNPLGAYLTGYTTTAGTYPLPTSIEFNTNQTYTIAVTAIDQGGLESSSSITTITKAEEGSIACDITPPSVNIHVNKTDQGSYIINLTCWDGESGCAQTYNYDLQPEGANCSGSLSTQTSMIGSTLTLASTGTFCYYVQDNAGNENAGSKDLTASITPDMQLVEPKFGIAKTKTFTFSIHTDKALTCRQGPLPATPSSDIATWYNGLQEFTLTGGNEHSTTIDATTISAFDTNQEEQIVPWVVICEENGHYFKKEFPEFGYDTTPPHITITYTPDPITNAESQDAKLSIQADDEVVCTYTDEEGIPRGFPTYNPQSRRAYTSNASTEVNYYGINNEDFLQKIKCRNVAQNVGTAEKTIHIEPANPLGIQLTSETYAKTTMVPIEITTSEDAQCTLTPNKQTQETFQTTGSTQHKKILTLDEGKNIIQIDCQAGNKKARQYETITVDLTDPKVQVITNPTTCSPTQIQLSILADGTGSPIEKTILQLETIDGQEINAPQDVQTNPITLTTQLDIGKQYKLKVTTTDKAGNTKSTTKTITAGTSNCDTTPPTAEINKAIKWEKIQVTTTCEDDNSCADTYQYFLNPNGNCEDNENIIINEETYDEQPINIFKPTTLCYSVFDKAGNVFSGQENISVQLQCFNGIEDPDETGIDCGGPCTATCGTCNNQVQDPFEEGVDCGYVCQAIASCQSQAPSTNDFECTTDLDCQAGYYCDIRNTCKKESKPTTYNQPPSSSSSSSLLGIILLILGLLLMGGGIGYIYYSRKQIAEQEKAQAATIMQSTVNNKRQSSAEQKAVEVQRKKQQSALAKKRAEEIEKIREAQAEKLKKKEAEKKQKRKSILDVFETKPQTKNSEQKEDAVQNTKDNEQKTSKNTPIKETTPKEKVTKKRTSQPEHRAPSNEQSTESPDDFVLLDELSKKTDEKIKSELQTKSKMKNTENKEDALAKLSALEAKLQGTKPTPSLSDKNTPHKNSEEKTVEEQKKKATEQPEKKQAEKTTENKKEKPAEKPKKKLPQEKQEESTFDKIDELAEETNLSTHPEEDYFTTLENTIDAAKGKSNEEIIESLATNVANIKGKISAEEFTKKFTNSALLNKLDKETTKELLAILVKEGHIDKTTADVLLNKK